MLIVITFLSTHKGYSQDSSLNGKFDNIIDQWFSTISKGDSQGFQSLLTDDFQLMAFGKRFNKVEITEMVKAYSDNHYTLSHVIFKEGDNLGYVSFDIDLKCKYNGKKTEGHAMEAYLLQKINNTWKISAKVIANEK